ncbi:hypothetical protein LQZ19_10365 [Treponema primitia]|uniref:hypothetical protein n=1 Tax=Treponema primitia TaxID=88058 RepID=UPI00397F1583
MIKRKDTENKQNISENAVPSDDIVTEEMVNRLFDALEDEEMCKYLGITDWNE